MSLTSHIVGVAHVHSTYSYDGQLSMAELAAVAKQRRWSFMLVTEHSDSLTPEAFVAAEAECQALSRDGFVMFPSIEYTCDENVHILGYNAGFIADFPTSPVALAREVRSRGGVAILAHPRKYTRRRPELLTEDLLNAVSGVEVWNSKVMYDGPWFAPVRNYDFVRPGGLALCGQDAHYYKHFSSLVIEMDVPSLTRDHIMQCIAGARFRMTNGFASLDPHGMPAGRARTVARATDAAVSFALTQALRVRKLIKGDGTKRVAKPQ